MKKFIFSLFVFISFFSLTVGAVEVPALYAVDDRDTMFNYSARTAVQSSQAYDYTGSRIASSGSIQWDFFGDRLIIHTLKAPYGSKIDLYIDGSLYKQYVTEAHTANSYVRLTLDDISGLGNTKHNASIVCLSTNYPNYAGTSSSPYFYLDYVEFDHDPEPDSQLIYFSILISSLWIMFFIHEFAPFIWRGVKKYD